MASYSYSQYEKSRRRRARDERAEARAARRRAARAAIRIAKQTEKKAENAANRNAHPYRTARRQARRAVINYATEQTSVTPTIENLRLAWDTFTEKERRRFAPKLVRRISAPGTDPGLRKLDPDAESPEGRMPAFLRPYAPKAFDAYFKRQGYARRAAENAGEMNASDLSRAVEVGLMAVPVGTVIKGAQYGFKGIQALRAARAAEVAAEGGKAARVVKVAEEGAGAATKAGRGARAGEEAAGAGTKAGGEVAGAGARGATKAGSKVGKAAARARATRTARLARTAAGTRAGRAAITTTKIGGKAAVYPLRHPVKSTAAYSGVAGLAAVPSAVSSGDLGKIPDAIIGGTGTAADVMNAVGGKLDDFGVIGNAARDILELPAATVPSAYLFGKALVSAAQGDDTELKAQLKTYLDEGLLPAIFEGDVDQALAALKNHPIYSALELSGAKAVAGRGAGKLARAGAFGEAGKRAGSTKRAPLAGEYAPIERSYSGDLINKAFQKRADRRREKREGGQYASPREAERALGRERPDRMVSAENALSRVQRDMEAEDAIGARPSSEADQIGVSLAVRGIIRSARSFDDDLARYGEILDDSLPALLKTRDDKSLPKTERKVAAKKVKANRKMHKALRLVRKKGDAETIMAAAGENVRALREIDDALVDAGLLDPRQAQQARLIDFAVTHLDARYGRSNETKAEIARLKAEGKKVPGKLRNYRQIIDKDGNALPPERLEAIRRQMGGQETGFISSRPRDSIPASYYRPGWNARQSMPKAKKTGKAIREGTFDPGYDTVLLQRLRGRTILSAIRLYDGVIKEFGLRENGKLLRFDTYAKARDFAEHFDQMEMVPVREAPFLAKKGELQRAQELHDDAVPDEHPEMLAENQVADAWERAKQPGPGPIVLMPRATVQRLDAHFTRPQQGFKAIQALNQQFKGTVLPFSTKWLAGNLIDINMRTMLDGNVPFGLGFDQRLFKKVIERAKEIDPVAGAKAEQALAPGMHMTSQEALRVFRGADQFNPNTALGQFARRYHDFFENPTPARLKKLMNGYRHYVFSGNERFIERPVSRQLAGKALRRELRETTGKWRQAWRIGDDAIEELAHGLLETPKQIKYAKEIERITGQWTANSPAARWALATYSPFGMWTRAATKFVFLTLPVHHPIKTAIIANIEQMTAPERQAMGLSYFTDTDRPVPDNLMGSIPLPGGGLQPVGGLTSFGYFADPGTALSTAVLPQLAGALDNLRGLDYTGGKLVHEDGTPFTQQERWLEAMRSTVESLAPGLAPASRAIERGPVAALSPRSTPLDPGLVDWLRDQADSRQITVPAHPSGSSSSGSSPWTAGSPSGSSAPWTK